MDATAILTLIWSRCDYKHETLNKQLPQIQGHCISSYVLLMQRIREARRAAAVPLSSSASGSNDGSSEKGFPTEATLHLMQKFKYRISTPQKDVSKVRLYCIRKSAQMQCTSVDTSFCSTVLLNFDSNSMLGLMMSLTFSVPDCLCSHSCVQATLNTACDSAYLSQGTRSASRSATVPTHVEIYLSLSPLGQFEILNYKTKVKYCRSQLKSIYNKM